MKNTTLFTFLSVLFFSGVSVYAASGGSLTEAQEEKPTDLLSFYMQERGISDDLGMLFLTGTHFEGSDTNVVVDTSVEVTMMLETTDQEVPMYIYQGADSTTFTVSGMAPVTVYYLYQDSYLDVTVITTDTTGSYTFTLDTSDTSDNRYVWFQPYPSTKFLRDDTTGGDCSNVGTWDLLSKTCTLTQDLTESVQINSSGITLDCAGHKITGPGFGNGVFIPASLTGVTITDCEISAFTRGINAVDSGGFHTFTSNNIHDIVRDAIRFLRGEGSNIIQDNVISDVNGSHIFLINSNRNQIIGNNLEGSSDRGILLRGVSNFNTISWNQIDISAFSGIELFGFGSFPDGPFEGSSFNEITHNDITIVGEPPFGAGIFLNHGSNENTIHSNTIFVDRPNRGGGGILFDVQANGNIVTSNTVDFTNGGIGIGMESGSGVGCDDLYVSENSITGALSPIVILSGNRNIIENNHIQNSGAARLWGGSNNVFRNNVIGNGMNVGNDLCFVGDVCQVVGQIDCNLDMGIHVSGETGSTITGNVIRNIVGEGIVVSELVREKRDFTPETLQKCHASFPLILPPLFDPPMFETFESINNTISSNVFLNNGGNGVELTWADNNQITDNQIEQNGDNGILLDSSNNNLVTDNEIEDCGGQGILEVGASAGNVFANNEIRNCP